MKKRENRKSKALKVVEAFTKPSPCDSLGMYSASPNPPFDTPTQDADDL